MFLKVNGEFVEIKDGANIGDLLEKLEMLEKRVAVELNGDVIPYSDLLDKTLQDQDIVEIVKAIGGG